MSRRAADTASGGEARTDGGVEKGSLTIDPNSLLFGLAGTMLLTARPVPFPHRPRGHPGKEAHMGIGSLFSSGTLSKQWREAKSKVDGAALKEMKLQDDFGPELDKLGKARADISGWVDAILKAGADVVRLRASLLQTCDSYKLKAEGKKLPALAAALDGLRGEVVGIAQEVGKVVEAATSVK